MFTNALFLILLLLLASFAGDLPQANWRLEPLPAFVVGTACYVAFLWAIFLQKRLLRVNLGCLLFFLFYYFFLGAQRIFGYASLIVLNGFLLYLGALAVFYRAEARSQIRLLIPFALPLLLFTLVADLWDSWIPLVILLSLILIFMPLLLIPIWKCAPLEDAALKNRLEVLCQRARFSHAGFMTWGVMDHLMTAAIVGVIAPLRYIFFTKKLLRQLSPQAVEAVVAHEIGHHAHRHMLFYPLIFLGMGMLMALFASCCTDFLLQIGENRFFPFCSMLPWL